MSDIIAPSRVPGVGEKAPNFTLPTESGGHISLESLHGRPVVLVFYPADFSPVCSDQLVIYSEILPEFSRFGAQILGISVDGPWCHKAFAAQRQLDFPLLSDSHPKGAVAAGYGVYREAQGISERAIFVIDSGGIIRWKLIADLGDNPGADGIIAALESLT
ncbi:MAG: redoxin domain-containing protein [Phycisphaerae bacterium]|nr:redoxin domain-containing protein [Phycisphaerae bacterium]